MERTVNRDLYARVGLQQIPHILSMVDGNLLSPTYGCFDRSYWHYKTSAFPSGMYQEFVLPLALVYRHAFPGGEAYHRQSRIKELALAGIRYAARASHKDGSCDDYFPYERAFGAAAFSLYAATETYLLLELSDEELLGFFKTRAAWLANHQEAGRLANHQALCVLALYNVYEASGEARFRSAARRRLQLLLGWQSPEGWFPEYEGCDPGYLTATIDFLAKYHQKSSDPLLRKPLEAAVRCAGLFMHPDGSYGGEYGSRNTCLFFPHGFELLAPYLPEARCLADLYLSRGIPEDRRVHLDDDRLCAHLTYNHLQAYLDFWERPAGEVSKGPPQSRYLAEARIYVHSSAGRYAVVSAAKGGVIRLYRDGEPAAVDSGIIARLADGTILVSNLVDRYEVSLQEDGIQVAGHLGRCTDRLPTVLGQAFFHLAMLTVGRRAGNLSRRLLQRLLIVGKQRDPMRFRRTILFGAQTSLVDELWHERRARPGRRVTALYLGTDHSCIYVAASHCYQRACLSSWRECGEFLEPLNRQGYVRIERTIG